MLNNNNLILYLKKMFKLNSKTKLSIQFRYFLFFFLFRFPISFVSRITDLYNFSLSLYYYIICIIDL